MALKQKKILIWSLISVLAVAAILFFSLFAYQKAYAEKIYPNIYFGEINLSGKTQKQAEIILRNTFNKVLSKEVTINANGKTVKVNLADTGLSFNYQQIADESFQIGRADNILDNFLDSGKTIYKIHKLTATPFVNQEKYDSFVAIAVAQLNIDPIDATLSIQSGEIKITESQAGQRVSLEKLSDQIVDIASTGQTEIALSVENLPPGVERADFSVAAAEAQGYLDKEISFANEGNVYTPTRNEKGLWLNFVNVNGTYQVKLNDSNIKAYLNKIAKNFEVKKADRKIDAQTGAVIEEGRGGVYLDKDKALADMKAQIGGSKCQVVLTLTKEDPSELKVSVNADVTTGRFEGKYVDVNLSTQKLCRIEGLNVIACHTISSGKPSTPTPVGTFAIMNKDPKRWSNQFGLWMPFWQQFADGGYGLHELPEWPNGYKEGQAHLGTPVSHGCIRLGIGEAEQLFNWSEIGTPLYIHK